MALKKKKLSLPVVWLTVYSDLITNEALFFMMLFASVLIAYQKGMTNQEFKDYMRGVSTSVFKREATNQVMRESGTRLARIEGVEGVRIGDKDLSIVLPEPLLFEPGQARLKESARGVLVNVGKVLAPSRFNIVVEGHTCDLPILQTARPGMKRWQLALERSTGYGPYYSNRELSGARALQVLQFFTREKIIAPERMSASAYGSSVPLAPNDCEENRRKNRRVELRLVLPAVVKP